MVGEGLGDEVRERDGAFGGLRLRWAELWGLPGCLDECSAYGQQVEVACL